MIYNLKLIITSNNNSNNIIYNYSNNIDSMNFQIFIYSHILITLSLFSPWGGPSGVVFLRVAISISIVAIMFILSIIYNLNYLMTT